MHCRWQDVQKLCHNNYLPSKSKATSIFLRNLNLKVLKENSEIERQEQLNGAIFWKSKLKNFQSIVLFFFLAGSVKYYKNESQKRL